jgi:hypothetical protein
MIKEINLKLQFYNISSINLKNNLQLNKQICLINKLLF